jgi:hypothetical protein
MMNDLNLLVSLFQFAEKGGELDRNIIVNALSSYGRSIQPSTLDESFKNIRIGTRNALNLIDSCLDESLQKVKVFNKKVLEVESEFGQLPDGASVNDEIDTIRFIDSLKKDVYNFSDASKLIGLTRQTIKEHADKNIYNLSTLRIGKTDYISREIMIKYYRAYFEKDGFGF